MSRPGRRWSAVVVLAVLVLLAGCTSGSSKPAPTTAPPSGGLTGPSTPTTFAVQPLGAKFDLARAQSYLPYLSKLKGGLSFTEVTWCDVQSSASAQPDWSSVDEIVALIKKAGMTPALKLRIGACWATTKSATRTRGQNKTESAPPADLDAYRGFVHAVVARYAPQGVREFAIENEVNSPSMWSGSVSQYVALTEAAAAEIRSSDRDAEVVDAGISSTAYGVGIAQALLDEGKGDEAVSAYNTYYQRRFGTRGKKIVKVSDTDDLKKTLDQSWAKTDLDYLNAVTDLAKRKVVAIRQVHFYEASAAVPELVDYLRTHTPSGVPIEAWEVGSFWPGQADDASQSGELTRTVALLLAGGVRRVIWLPTAYNPDGRQDSEQRYGLLNPDGSSRQSGIALVSLADASDKATAQPVSMAGAVGVAFGRGSSTVFVLWRNDSGSARLTVSGGTGLRANSLTGGSSPASGQQVTVGQAPVLLQVSLPLTKARTAVR